MYKQAVESTDVFLGMGGKDESSTSCEQMVVKVALPHVNGIAGAPPMVPAGPGVICGLALCPSAAAGGGDAASGGRRACDAVCAALLDGQHPNAHAATQHNGCCGLPAELDLDVKPTWLKLNSTH